MSYEEKLRDIHSRLWYETRSMKTYKQTIGKNALQCIFHIVLYYGLPCTIRNNMYNTFDFYIYSIPNYPGVMPSLILHINSWHFKDILKEKNINIYNSIYSLSTSDYNLRLLKYYNLRMPRYKELRN